MIFGNKKSTKKTQLEFTRSVKAHKSVEENIVYEDELFEYVEVDEFVAEDYQDDFEESEIPQFYQGNFPVPPPVPPPPYFVPPSHFYPHFIAELPDEFVEEEVVEEYNNVSEEAESDVESQVDFDVDEVLDDEFEQIEITASPLASMQSEKSNELLKEGLYQETLIKNGKFTLGIIIFFKWVVSIIVVVAMIAGCAYIVKSFFDNKTSKQGEIVQGRDARVGSFSWNMPAGRVRSCLEAFYLSIGVPKNYISADDELLRGEIKSNNISDSIYCIKKRIERKTFIKIGAGNTSKTYLVSNVIDGVYRLIDGGMSGNRRELEDEKAWVIRSLIDFDDSIFMRAFSRDFKEEDLKKISYEGEVEIDGKFYQTISLVEDDDTIIEYFFSNKTSRLYKTKYTQGKAVIEVFFDDYKSIDDEQFRPYSVKVLVNSKPYAEIKFDFIVKRDGLIFPN